MTIGTNGTIPTPPAYYRIKWAGKLMPGKYSTFQDAYDTWIAMDHPDWDPGCIAAFDADGTPVNAGY